MSDKVKESKSESESVVEALDRIRDVLEQKKQHTDIGYPQLAIGHDEQVLVFNTEDHITLNVDDPTAPYFFSHGELTDLWGNPVPGGTIQSALPADPNALPLTLQWPNPQPSPFDKPPVDNTNTTDIGFAKTVIYFGDGSSIVTVGPSFAKVGLLKGGGAQFWESSCEAISQGTGKYDGAKGKLAFVGSAYFPEFPADPNEVIKLLAQGFKAKIVRCVKLVLKKDIVVPPPPPKPPTPTQTGAPTPSSKKS
jgi:hypothetical protein